MLLNEAMIILPLERAVHIVLSLFVLLESIIGYFAVRAIVNYQVTKFHMRQFTDLQQIPEDNFGSANGFNLDSRFPM